MATLLERKWHFRLLNTSLANNGLVQGLKGFDDFEGFFFFKFDSRAGLEAVMESGTWLILKSMIILKKWSMDTRLLKEELTHILIWVKLHDVPIQVSEENDISLIATFLWQTCYVDSYTSLSVVMKRVGRSSFARCLIEVNSDADLVDVVTIGIPSLSREGFTKETIRVEYEWRPPRCDICRIFSHVHDHCPKKVFVGPSVKQTIRYEPKATTSAPKKGVTNVGNTSQSTSMLKTTGYSSKKDILSISNSFSALNDEEEDDEEDVQNVYDESANLFQNTKAGGSSSFTATVVCHSSSIIVNIVEVSMIVLIANLGTSFSMNDFDSSGFDQPPQYPIVHPPLHEISLQELISYMPPSIAEIVNRHVQRLDEMQSEINSIMMNLGTFIPEPLVNSVVYKESDDNIEVPFDDEQILR
ncbi:zinc knuckle CX2CX4HX4C containing protein [Tanacetum coccineum]